MHLMSSAHAEQQLAQLANQFAHWRQSRTTRFEHIPAPLWEQAIELSQVLPLAQVAKRLRLRGSDLKKRCGAPPAPGVGATPSTALGFVEVPSPPPGRWAPQRLRLISSGPMALACVSTVASPKSRSRLWCGPFWRRLYAPADPPKPYLCRHRTSGFSQRDRWTRGCLSSGAG